MRNEEWKPIPGFNGEYEASTYGQIRSVSGIRTYTAWGKTIERRHTGKTLKPLFDGRGAYLQVPLSINGSSRRYLVHRLVAITFIDNPNGLPEVNHMDEDKTNNAVWNLEWCDHKYNNNYGSKRIMTRGTKNGAAKISEELVRTIRKEYVPNDPVYGMTGLSQRYGVSLTHVYNIIKRKRWGWLE